MKRPPVINYRYETLFDGRSKQVLPYPAKPILWSLKSGYKMGIGGEMNFVLIS